MSVERAVEMFSESGLIRLVDPTNDSKLLQRRYVNFSGANSHSVTVVATPRAQEFAA
jgi:hypothetical protein